MTARKKAAAARAAGERAVQQEVARWLDASPLFADYWFHPPNERSERTQAYLLKRAGVKAGVPDVLVIRPAGPYVGLALELKRPGAPPSALRPAQRLWLERFRECGWMAEAACGEEEALAVLGRYARLVMELDMA